MGLSRQSAPGLVRIPFRTGQIGRRLPLPAITFLFLAAPVALAAQQAEPIASPTQASPPERVDLLAQSREIASENAEGELENCSETDEATLISGEIVVCRRSRDDTATYGFDKKAWEERYAAETRGADPVDVAGPGIFRGAPTVGGLCIPGLQKCPPPPAIVVDFAALPEAPPGSDADRIARGLPPLGRDGPRLPPPPAQNAETLDLPPPPDFAREDEDEAAPVSPEGSAAPTAPQ